ncbi:winged helix-turn-helix transcriptional regulator [Streptomyces anulatus]
MGGKWKGLILFWLGEEESLRFGQLRRTVAGISERMLTLQLRELEAAGLVHREVHEQVPPKVEYSLTDFGRSLVTALMPLGEWGEEHQERIEALSRTGSNNATASPSAPKDPRGAEPFPT